MIEMFTLKSQVYNFNNQNTPGDTIIVKATMYVTLHTAVPALTARVSMWRCCAQWRRKCDVDIGKYNYRTQFKL
jgi:hypothetical protein